MAETYTYGGSGFDSLGGIDQAKLITLSPEGEMLSIMPLVTGKDKMTRVIVTSYDPQSGYVLCRDGGRYHCKHPSD